MERIALIPARGGSKRIPGKNIAALQRRPIIGYTIENAVTSGLFDEIVVSTDDNDIAETAHGFGAAIHWRDARLATDEATVVSVCADYLSRVAEPPEHFCCIYATAAFISVDDLIGSEALLDERPEADVVMGVSGYPIHPYKAMSASPEGFLRPQWPEENAKKSQEFPDFVASNGTIYWARTSAFLANPTFYPERLKGYRMPAERAIDIDTPDDLEWARRVMAIRASTSNGSGV